MKIYKLANMNDRDMNSEINPPETTLDTQTREDLSEGKGKVNYTAEVLNKILSSGIGNKMKESWFTASGSVGWLEYDGTIYEIAVSPAKYGKYYSIFKIAN